MNIEKLIRDIKPNLNIKSLKSYINNINIILKETNSDDLSIFKNKKIIIDFLDKKKSFLTKRNYLNSIIVLLQHDNKVYNDEIIYYQNIRDGYNQEYKNNKQNNKKNNKEIANWLTMKQINEIIDHLKQDLSNEQNLIWYFMLNFWVEFPLRNDLQHTEIISKKKYDSLLDEELKIKNYFVLDKEPFISISQYKTFKRYGIKKIIMNQKMKDILLLYLPKNKTKYLLYNIKNKSAMGTDNITHSFNKLFQKYYPEKKISTTMIRHIVLSEKFGNNLLEQKKYCDIMGHDLNTQTNIYIKHD